MVTRVGPAGWLSAEEVDSDGHAAFRLNVNVVGGTGAPSDVTIIAPLGTNTVAASVSVTPATASSWAITAASLPLPSGAATEATLAAMSAKLPASLGAKTGAASFSVVPASDGFAVTISGTAAVTQSGTWNITNISGTVSLPTGASTEATLSAMSAKLPAGLGSAAAAASLAVTASTEDVARTGIITETAPATDTASSGLNGRLQRIAQRVTSLIALIPASLGRKSAALSLAVAPAGMPYETVAAGVTDQVLGGSGAANDFLSHIVIQPVTTAAGAVTVKDGASTIYLFTSGTLADLSPKTVPFGIFSAGALSVSTGTNVTVLAVGNFT